MLYLCLRAAQSVSRLRQLQGQPLFAEAHPRPRGDGRRSQALLRVWQTRAEEPALRRRRWGAGGLHPVPGRRVGIRWGVGLIIGKHFQVLGSVGRLRVPTGEVR